MTVLLTLADIRHNLLAGKPRRRFVIPDFIPVGPALLYGASGTGKTGLAIRTAVAVAAGLQWAGRDVVTGSVLYVAGEDFDNAQDRIAAACQLLGLPDDLPIAIMEGSSVGLISNDFRNDIELRASEIAKRFSLPVSLIVIDTLAACFGPKSQDDATAASEYMNNAERIAKRIGCAVLSIHHTGKAESSGMRGSQVFFDRADAVIRVKPGKGSTAFAEVEKLRNGIGRGRVAFEIGGIDIPSSAGAISVQVVRHVNALEDAKQQSKEEIREKSQDNDRATALGLLLDLVANGAASRKDWQAACYAAWETKPNNDARKNAFSKAVKKLAEAKQIAISGDVVTVTVTENSQPSGGYDASPENVTVTVTSSPFKGGRTEAGYRLSQKQEKGSSSTKSGDEDGSIGKAKALHRRAGGETPAEDYGTPSYGYTGTEG